MFVLVGTLRKWPIRDFSQGFSWLLDRNKAQPTLKSRNNSFHTQALARRPAGNRRRHETRGPADLFCDHQIFMSIWMIHLNILLRSNLRSKMKRPISFDKDKST